MKTKTERPTAAIVKKAGKILSNAVLYAFVLLGLLSVVLTLTAKRSQDGTVRILGYEGRIVLSGSMEKCEATWDEIRGYRIKDIPLRSMIVVQTVPQEPSEARAWYGALSVGDVLTFRYFYNGQVTVTHRIRAIEEKPSGGYIIRLIGDNRSDEAWGSVEQVIDTDQSEISPNFVLGKVVGQSPAIGWVIYAKKKPTCLLFFIILPSALLILYEIVRIRTILHTGKEEAAARERDEEVELLRQKIAALEAASRTADIDREETEEILPDQD